MITFQKSSESKSTNWECFEGILGERDLGELASHDRSKSCDCDRRELLLLYQSKSKRRKVWD